jgi:DNA-binding response OmpR family regulator
MAHKVLVIDDEPLMVKSTCMALKFNGFETAGAPDGPAGLREVALHKPDVILLDIMMPDMDGWEVLSRLKADEGTKNIPVIIFTAREYSNGNAMAESRGAVDYVAKPFDLSDLMSIIRRQVQ